MKVKGLVAAVFSPMREDGALNPAAAEPVVEHLIRDGVEGLYVCGSTGEGPSLSSEERMTVAEAYVAAAGRRLPVIIQVGHDSLAEARRLAAHAKAIGADAIAALPPCYFVPGTLDVLFDCLADISAAAPGVPFFYYHIPSWTGVDPDMVEFVRRAGGRIPSFAGVKFSAAALDVLQECLTTAGDRITILFGMDDMLLSGLAAGAPGAVGSTYNFAAPLYRRLIAAFARGDLRESRRCQTLSVRMIRTLYRYRGHPAFKAVMGMLGVECGPVRLPLVSLTAEERAALRQELKDIGFFSWGREHP